MKYTDEMLDEFNDYMVRFGWIRGTHRTAPVKNMPIWLKVSNGVWCYEHEALEDYFNGEDKEKRCVVAF